MSITMKNKPSPPPRRTSPTPEQKAAALSAERSTTRILAKSAPTKTQDVQDLVGLAQRERHTPARAVKILRHNMEPGLPDQLDDLARFVSKVAGELRRHLAKPANAKH